MKTKWWIVCLAVVCAGLPSAHADQKAKRTKTAKAATTDLGVSKVPSRADVLVITDTTLAEAWDDFADWKTRTGRPTKIVTVQAIEDGVEGDDIQAKIRRYCLDHIDSQQTRWIILGGDSEDDGGLVPDRDTDHSGFFRYKNLPTDVYYLSPGNWDANDDGIYGRFDDDLNAVDYVHPKASIGRIPVRTADDVAAYTQKVIEYESRYPAGDFARQMLWTCPEKHAYPKLETSREAIASVWKPGQMIQFFADRTPWDEKKTGDHDLTAEHWAALVNDKTAGKMHMHGHGLNHLWVLENKSVVTATTVDTLTNHAAYPVVTTVSCFTGQFDSARDPSITESMVRKDKAGAIAIVAPSREGIPVFHDPSDMRLMISEGKMDGTTETLTRFWKHALTDNGTIGEALAAAKEDMTPHARRTDGYHFVLCELNLLGDPTLDTRSAPVTDIPAKATVVKGKQNREIVISGVKGCEVSAWDGEGWYHSLEADSDGQARFVVPAKKVGSIHLSARAPSRNIWTDDIDVNR